MRNIDDLVTHLPPAVFGYSHVGELLTVGEKGKYTRIEAHLAKNLAQELIRYDQSRKELKNATNGAKGNYSFGSNRVESF